MKLLICLSFGFFCYSNSFSQIAEKWVYIESIQSTVFLEKEQSGQFIPHGTGFLVLPYKGQIDIIVTCEHLLRNNTIYATLEVNEQFRKLVRTLPNSEQQKIVNVLKTEWATIWNIEENFFRVKVTLIKDSTFFTHPSGLDVAAFKIRIPNKISIADSVYNVNNTKAIGRSRINNRFNIELGDDTYFIGFPFGIGSPQSAPSQSNYSSNAPRHLVRKGTIAWKSNDYDEFLLDALSYGGNSGSPLFQLNFIPGGPGYYLIGIIIGHLSDNNSSSNIGLARCISTDEINKVLMLVDK